MLQARVLLCLSLAAVQVWAQGTAGGGTNQSGTSFKCYEGNPWWTFMNNTSGDACHIALDMRRQAGLAALPSETTDRILRNPESAQLCLPVVYDMYGACLACREPSPPETSMIESWTSWCNTTAIDTTDNNPAVTLAIESLAPEWTQKVNFTGRTWDLNEVRAAAGVSLTATEAAPPGPTGTTGSGSPQATPPSTGSSSKKSNVGPIVGGIIGALALISIGAAVIFFYLRRQRNRKVAPSSEFTKYIQPGGTMSTRPETALSGRSGTVPRQDSATIPLTAGEDEVLEAPPAFTPGQYTGPVFEKDGYRADPNNPLYASGNAASPSQSQNSPQGPSGSALA